MSSSSNITAPDVAELHRLNWPYIDRARWGWTVAGGIADVLPPHERARRPETQKAHVKARKEWHHQHKQQQQQQQSLTAAKRPKINHIPSATVAYGGSIERTTVVHPGSASSAAASTSVNPSISISTTTKSIRTSLLEHNPLLPWKSPASSPQEEEENEKDSGKATVPKHSQTLSAATQGQTDTSQSNAKSAAVAVENALSLEKVSTTDASQKNNIETVTGEGQQDITNKAPPSDTIQQPMVPNGDSLPVSKAVSASTTTIKPSDEPNITHKQVPSAENSNQNRKKTLPSNPPLSQRLEFPALMTPPASSDSAMNPTNKEAEPVLDMFTYHRGREGMEYRDPHTGQWLTDVREPTDTGHYQHYESPDTVISLHISFPLSDTNNAIFKDTIQFDLLQHRPEDAGTTSMQLASDIALEFGLDFGQTMDLAESIQRQLRSVYYQQKHESPIIMAAVDPYSGHPRDAPLKSTVVHWHGQVKNDTPGLSAWTPEEAKLPRPSRGSIQRGGSNLSSASSKKSSQRRATTGGIKSKQRPKAATPKMTMPKNVEEVYVEEVQKRLQKEGSLVLRLPLETDASAPRLRVQNGVCCHRCKKKRDNVAVFSCGCMMHSLCLTHLGWLKDGTEGSKKRQMPVCPVCSLSCTCSGCRTKLANLANVFKMKTLEQECALADTSFADLWGFVQENLVSFSFTSDVKPVSFADVPSKKRVGGQNDSVSLPPPSKRSKSSKRSLGIVVDEAMDIPPPVAKPKQHVFNIPPNAKIVPAISAEEFPVELSQDGENLDPGTLAEYAATYTEKGPILPADFKAEDKDRLVAEAWKDDRLIPPASAKSKKKIDLQPSSAFNTVKAQPEDGSVDFCLECNKPGELLCCDFCPRAFHPGCLHGEQASAAEKSPWLCPRCVQQRDGLQDDLLDGQKSHRRISALYKEDGDPNMIKVIAIILDMLKVLMGYDFGRIFAEPVDPNEVPLYRETIKKPMDLGTVSSNILNQSYKRGKNSLEDVVVSALNDVELIWQNCMAFNLEGSSYYRMAEVLRRKTNSIRMKSFETLLTPAIKGRLNDFLEIYGPRGAPVKSLPSENELLSQTETAETSLGKKEYFIRVPGRGNAYQARAVAVLNPNTNRVVKIYGTMKNAGFAVRNMLDRGVPCEFPAYFKKDIIGKIRRVVYGSKDNPRVLLFGHRWIELIHLKDGTVTFASSAPSNPTSTPDKDLGSGNRGTSSDGVTTKNEAIIVNSAVNIKTSGTTDAKIAKTMAIQSSDGKQEPDGSNKPEKNSSVPVLDPNQREDSVPSTENQSKSLPKGKEEVSEDTGFNV